MRQNPAHSTDSKPWLQQGFSLVEILVVLAIGSLLLAAIYGTYIFQIKTFGTQGQVVAMQQNLRSGLFFLERELRMAGYNPTSWDSTTYDFDGLDNDCDGDVDEVGSSEDIGDFGITAATQTSISFTLDVEGNGAGDGDGDVCDSGGELLENVTYALVDGNLVRTDNTPGGITEPVAENIEVLDFVYLKGDGTLATDPADIRAVQIAMVARTATEDKDFTDNNAYQNLQGTEILAAPGDGFRRRVLSIQVNLRNLGN